MFLVVVEGAGEPSSSLIPGEDADVLEVVDDHQGGWSLGLFVVPAEDGGLAFLDVPADEVLDEVPDHQAEQEDEAERFDAFGFL